ncbi:MAG: DUF3226 domain-containing protein [Christensenellales bacterium]|jgi:hypothetical protein
MRTYYFITEGAHDAAAVGRALYLEGFRHQRKASMLPVVWQRLLPRTFPFVGDELDVDAPVPFFYRRGDQSVAVRMAGGIGKLLETMDSDFYVMHLADLKHMRGVALFMDADHLSAGEARECLVQSAAKANEKRSDEGEEPLCFSPSFLAQGRGEIFSVELKSGVYVFPDNASSGTLEDLLLDAAKVVYPEIYRDAFDYVDLAVEKKASKLSGSAKKKATVGCLSNVRYPGKSNQISIYLDRWISRETADKCQGVRRLMHFVQRFLQD